MNKTFSRSFSLLAAAILVMSGFFVAGNAMAATKTWNQTTGGSWTTASNWTPNSVPATGDDVIINSDQSSVITGVPTRTLNSLNVSGNVTLRGSAIGNTITITTTFSVSAGKTLTMGPSSGRMNFTLSSTATGTINGIVTMDSGTNGAYTFTNNGTLIIAPAGILNGDVGFSLTSGATIQIGSTAGITSSGATGNIQVTKTRTFNTGANYTYNGTSTQVTGSGLPSTVNNLTINNAAGVILSNPLTVNGLLTLTSGKILITVTAAASTKTYDGTTASGGTPTITTGHLISGHMASWTQTFDYKNVGTNKILTPAGTVNDGNGGNDYFVIFVPVSTGTINKKTLTVSATGVNKVYDGNTNATVNFSSGAVPSDNITITGNATFDGANVGAHTIYVSGVVFSGADAGNYNFNSSVPNTAANITKAPLAITANNRSKPYGDVIAFDGTEFTTIGLISGDSVNNVTLNSDGVISTATAGSYDIVPSAATGPALSNYTISYVPGTLTVDPRSISGTVIADNKPYDGNTTATISSCSLSGLVNSDTVNTVSCGNGVATFDNKNAGNGKTVTAKGLSLSGPAARNYSLLNTTVTTHADITAIPLTVSATGVNKVYDGTTAANVTLTTNKIGNDDVTASGVAIFSDPNVGDNKQVSVSGISISGADAGNYIFNTTATTTASITVAPLTITANNASKTYGDTITFAGTEFTASGLQNGDTVASVTLTSDGAASTAKVFGSPYQIVPSVAVGPALSNYTISYIPGTLTVNQKSLTVSATGINKVYDANTDATVTLSTDKISGDDITPSYISASFADPNVGDNKPVSVSGILISGADAGNYTFNDSATTTASITPNSGTITLDKSNLTRQYDGTPQSVLVTSATPEGIPYVVLYSNSTYSSSTVAPTAAGTYNILAIITDPNSNYAGTDTATLAITALPITVTAAADTKVYDGTTSSIGVPTITSGSLVNGETATWIQTFNNKNVGLERTLTPAGTVSGGNGGNNYIVTFVTAIGSITVRPITVTAVTDTKVYDGTTSSAGTPTITFGSLATGDTATWTQTFDTAEVKTGKTLKPTGTVNNGNGGNNYDVTFVNDTTGVITAQPILVTGVTLKEHTATLTVGGTDQLTATVSPSDASNKNVTWASDTLAVATVDANGKVTAVSAGTATITVTTVDGGKTDADVLTITSGGGGGSAPTPVQVSYRIEGPSAQLCSGTGSATTAMDVLNDAQSFCGLTYHITQYSFGPYVDQIGTFAASGDNGWNYYVNFVSPLVGASNYSVSSGDEVVWAFGGYGDIPLKVSISSSQISAGQSVAVTVTEYSSNSWTVAPAGINVHAGNNLSAVTNSSGTATFSSLSSGTYSVYADGAGYVRSAAVVFTVSSPSGGGGISYNNSFGGTTTSGGGAVTALPKTKTGDANGDDKVDEIDLSLLMSQWGQKGTGLSGDLNKDGVVDELDFGLLMANWGL